MTLEELRNFAGRCLRRPEILDINNEAQYVDETFNIDFRSGRWHVYHFERGTYSLERSFDDEASAIDYLLRLLEEYDQLKPDVKI